MRMNVQPIPTVSERINEIRALTAQIVNKEILPEREPALGRRTNARLTDERRRAGRASCARTSRRR